jgi:hypothetical protein
MIDFFQNEWSVRVVTTFPCNPVIDTGLWFQQVTVREVPDPDYGIGTHIAECSVELCTQFGSVLRFARLLLLRPP